MFQCFELKQNVTRSAKCGSAFLWVIFTIEDICAKEQNKRVTIKTGLKLKIKQAGIFRLCNSM